jgi:type II secretory pathway pseudopilin PulG
VDCFLRGAHFICSKEYYKGKNWRLLMSSLRKNRTGQTSGFSLLEMTMVVALIMILATVSFMSLQPMLRQQRVNNAYNTVLSAMRLARDNSVAQRTSYVVIMDSTTTPHSIRVQPTLVGPQGIQAAVSYSLPQDVGFNIVGGIPTNPTKTPDGFGTGAKSIDFGYTSAGTGVGGSSSIYFCPDGTAQSGAGQCTDNLNGGVVYIARAGELLSSRAITVWGATGRMRGWRLYNGGAGGVAWQRQ